MSNLQIWEYISFTPFFANLRINDIYDSAIFPDENLALFFLFLVLRGLSSIDVEGCKLLGKNTNFLECHGWLWLSNPGIDFSHFGFPLLSSWTVPEAIIISSFSKQSKFSETYCDIMFACKEKFWKYIT